jgi:hypothetical protein
VVADVNNLAVPVVEDANILAVSCFCKCKKPGSFQLLQMLISWLFPVVADANILAVSSCCRCKYPGSF